MFCPNCGAENGNLAEECLRCGTNLTRLQERLGHRKPLLPSKESDHLVLSILTMRFCCQLIGIVAVVYSALAKGRYGAGDFEAGARYARTAMTWIWVSVVLFAVYLVVVLGFVLSVRSSPQSGPGLTFWP